MPIQDYIYSLNEVFVVGSSIGRVVEAEIDRTRKP